jgi:hypothetical protein
VQPEQHFHEFLLDPVVDSTGFLTIRHCEHTLVAGEIIIRDLPKIKLTVHIQMSTQEQKLVVLDQYQKILQSEIKHLQ